MIPLDWLAACGWTATVIAVAGVMLNNARRRECFILWIGSNSLTAAVHLSTDPVVAGLIARDVIFLALAVAGWIQWGRSQR